MGWKQLFMDPLNHKKCILNIKSKDMWNSDHVKQLKYFLFLQTKLIHVYHCMENKNHSNANSIEHNLAYQDNSPFSQILANITTLQYKGNHHFGMDAIIFCKELLLSTHSK